jgi:hypothetical protein
MHRDHDVERAQGHGKRGLCGRPQAHPGMPGRRRLEWRLFQRQRLWPQIDRDRHLLLVREPSGIVAVLDGPLVEIILG